MSSLHRHWKSQAKGSPKHLQIEAEDRRAYKEETVTSQRLLENITTLSHAVNLRSSNTE